MEINYEIYGQPETWQDSFYLNSLNTAAANLLKASRAKVPTWKETHPDSTFGSSQLRFGVDDGKIEEKVPIDKSIATIGMAADSAPFKKLNIYAHYAGEDLQRVGSATVGEDNEPINIFWYEANNATAYGNYGNSAFSRWRIPLETLETRVWAPQGDNAEGTTRQNGNYYIAPLMEFGARTFVLQIAVYVQNSTTHQPPYTGEPAGTWRTLDDWKNNYSDHTISACELRVRYLSSYNANTGAMGYYLPEWESSQYRKGGPAILDEFKLKFEDGSSDVNFYTYAIQSAGANRPHLRLFGSIDGMYSWSQTLQPIALIPDWITESDIHVSSNNQAIFPLISYSDEVYETLMSAAAHFGVPFTPAKSAAGAASSCQFLDTYDDVDLCLPIIDEQGITHGEYTRGTENLENDYMDLDKSSDVNYDPTKPPAPIPSTDPILPEGLHFTMAGRGTGIWALTPSELDQVWADIFGSGVKPTMFGNNPMNAILSLKWTPFVWEPSGTDPYSPIVLGDTMVNELHEYPFINTVSTSERHAFGSIKFEFDKNFFNARYMQARLFLPFYGYYALPTAQLLSSTLRVDFYYNVPDELGVYIICYDDVIYDYVECCCDMEVPLTGSNAAAIAASKRSEALSIATTVAGMAINTVIGWSGMKAIGGAIRDIAEAGYNGYVNFGGGISGAWQNIKDSARILTDEGFWNTSAMKKGGVSLGANIIGGKSISNTVYNGSVERAALRTNLPYHGSALQTTFLHMSMVPYVQIFRNAIMEGLEDSGGVDQTLSGNSEAQYKLKVGHACDVWKTINEMPNDSLLQATGIADSTVVNMEIAEVQELNSILQSGFFK